MKTKISIEDYYDGFAITVNDKRFYIDQEADRSLLVDVFKELGFDAEYEEVY
jgi:hypothetical protein